MMSDFGGLDANCVASLVLRAFPGATLVVFDRELRVVFTVGLIPTRYGLRATEIAGSPVSEVVAPEQWQSSEPLFRAALEGMPGSIEIEAASDGRWYLVDVEPLREAAGKVVGGVCFWRDITERKQLVDALEQRGRLLDLAHDAVIVREQATSAVTYWNREASQLYGCSAEEARGRISHELLATEFPESKEAIDDVLLLQGRWEGDLCHVRADGRPILVSSRQALVRGARGEPLAVIELNSDITERKRAEHELREAEEHFRGLIESAPDAMLIVGADGTIVLVNAQAEELFGYPRAELVGRPVETLLPKDLRRRHVGHREDYMAEPRTRPMGEGMDLLARRKDGSEFATEISLSPLQTGSGLLVSAAVRDVSQQLLRHLEQALVPRMKIRANWQVAWRYRPAVRTVLLGGDFIGACERSDGSLALLIGDVEGRGAAAAGTGAMLRAAWLGAAQGDVPIESIPRLLHRLLINQVGHGSSMMATACLAEIDPQVRELRLIRAGHDSPLLITPGAVTGVNGKHGPALGLSKSGFWPLQRVPLPSEAAIMLFTDGLTERRETPESIRQFDPLAPRIDAKTLLAKPPGQAIDDMLAQIFPSGTQELDDDVAVILVNLTGAAAAEDAHRERVANSA
jgi:PAS domain S-box-containing protein